VTTAAPARSAAAGQARSTCVEGGGAAAASLQALRGTLSIDRVPCEMLQPGLRTALLPQRRCVRSARASTEQGEEGTPIGARAASARGLRACEAAADKRARARSAAVRDARQDREGRGGAAG